jgi:pilus assembly protein Flp/PilA
MNTIERATDKINETAYCVVAALQVAVADRRERGATAVEYALMVGLLALVIVGGVSVFRSKLSQMYISYANTLPG